MHWIRFVTGYYVELNWGGTEYINRVEVLESGELLLGIESDGHGYYQYVYREATVVYWDPLLKGFKSTKVKEWTPFQWYSQMVEVVRTGLGVELRLAHKVAWSSVPEVEKGAILANRRAAG